MKLISPEIVEVQTLMMAVDHGYFITWYWLIKPISQFSSKVKVVINMYKVMTNYSFLDL